MMEKKQMKISLGTFIVSIIAIILVAVIVIMGIHISNQNKVIEDSQVAIGNKESQQDKVAQKSDVTVSSTKENTVKELSVNSEIVKKLYSYVKSKYFMPSGDFTVIDSNGNLKDFTYPVLFYRENVTVSNLEDDLKILSVCSALYDEKLYNIRKVVDDEDIANDNIYVFSAESIQNKAKEMFNTTINITRNSFRWSDGDSIEYNAQTNSYEYVQYISGGGTDYKDEFKLIKAEQKGDEIYIYDNYVRGKDLYDQLADGTMYAAAYGFFATSDDKIEITGTQDNFGYDSTFELLSYLGYKLPVYKHTFKQRTDGTYYWVSTELTNKNELKAIQ